MSQNVVNYGIDPSGAQLLDELLSGEQQNRLTMDGGNSRPSYAEIGTVWTDKSVEGKATLKRFNGTSDNALMTIDETTGAITIPGIADTDLSNLSTTGKHYVAFKGYDAAETYALNDIVVNVDVDNNVKLYQSLADNNTSPLTDGTKWKEVSLGGGSGADIGDMGFAPLGIDESLNLRRYLNGQVISQTQFVSFTNKVKSAVVLFPSLATDEDTWQAEKLLSKFGQVGKFVIDDTAGTIRLPAVVNPQGLLSLSGIGNLVNESLPNIKGHIGVASYAPWSDSESGALYKTSQNHTIDDGSDIIHSSLIVNFDASRSSSTYQTDAPVQQEAIQYPYYIQVATGVEETLPAIREYKVNNSDYFGKSMYSAITPDNASWLASNGQYNSRTVYPDYYDWLVKQMNAGVKGFKGTTAYQFKGNTPETETYNPSFATRNPIVGSVIYGGSPIQARGYATQVNADGSVVVQDFVNNMNATLVFEQELPNIAWFDDYDFAINTTDQTFRLPLLNGCENIPDWTNAQNISTNVPFATPSDGWLYGAGVFTGDAGYILNGILVGLARGTSAWASNGTVAVRVKKGDVFSSNASFQAYGLNFIPAVGNGTLYYYVGDTVQDASLINAAAVLNTLSGKIGYDDLTTVHCVVETFKSGNSWYRVYDDGWVEQGGVAATVSVDGHACTITFLKPFSDTSYVFLKANQSTSSVTDNIFTGTYSGKTTTSIKIYNFSTYVSEASWFACGYGA